MKETERETVLNLKGFYVSSLLTAQQRRLGVLQIINMCKRVTREILMMLTHTHVLMCVHLCACVCVYVSHQATKGHTHTHTKIMCHAHLKILQCFGWQ